MAGLCGKGIWLAHSYDLQRATEIATHVGAGHLLVKVGHGPHFFPETTRNMLTRVRAVGLHPLGWVQITAYASQDALKAILAALTLGYEAVVLRVDAAPITQEQMHPLVQALDTVDAPRQRLYLCSPPLPYVPDRRAVEMLAPFCQAGWMPMSGAAWGESPEQIIDRDIYHALGDLSLIWGKSPDVYPVLSPLPSTTEAAPLPETFIPWIEGVTRHGIDFFSVFHAANVEPAVWPMLESVNIACQSTAERPTVTAPTITEDIAVPQPVYITVSASDTVWGIISRHGLNKERFWAWNAHLWDSRNLPRDPDYLQEGWRLRIK